MSAMGTRRDGSFAAASRFRDDDGMGEELSKPLAFGALVPNMAGLLASSGSMAGLKEYLIALGQEDRGDESDGRRRLR